MTDLSLAEQGRMISALRRNRHNGQQRWSDKLIREVLHMTPARFRKANEARLAEPYFWSRDSLADAVLKWTLAEGRWPASSDMDKAAPERKGLPARSTLAGHWGQDWRGEHPSPLAQLIQFVVEDDLLFSQLTPALILSIKNVTVRRAAMQKFGVERLLREGGGEQFQQDDYGTLWRLPSDNSSDDHAQWVEVENATPEPDGTKAHYFLRVPPSIGTAREAVAWTFESQGEDLDIKEAS